ncbi:DUF1592 domain-containing protein [Myxococcus sp. K15C18031901]|uniref:DUF1592 domain-containing protein n=1 Tax=Myxococcus dinghuensis TaxID=2906761 RepID=UPI0020A757C0|nr:DUF1592 domain-containing protein [Myxococcus dinghuensis]MCP3097791.1 DUF1592 domain-containing protein [Myxococcus dinghuensis]
MTLPRSVGILLLCAGAVACDGSAQYDHHPGGNEPEPPPSTSESVRPAPARFSCDANAVPADLPLPRLSRKQLMNTLRFAVARALPGEADALWAQLTPSLDRYPVDRRTPAPGDLKGGFSRLDQSIQQTQVDVMYDLGKAVAQELTSTDARRNALLGSCASDSQTANDRACLETFIRGWGSRVLRYPLPTAEVTAFADIAGATPVDRAAVADVITTLLNSPWFLYRIEHGTTAGQPVSPLSAFELAAKLSYQFWQAPPDDELWAAATDGSLLTESGFNAQLDRMMRSPQLRSSLDEFVSEWLRLEELPSLVALRNDAVYQAFVGAEMPTDATRTAMFEDVQRSAWNTVVSGGSVSDFLHDRRSYTADPFLAAIYGVPVWNGTGPAPVIPSQNRGGLLTRAALLATGTASTRPIHKGYLVRNALLCQQVGAPPPNASDRPPSPTEHMTTRQVVTQLTSGGSCGGCHNNTINPPGFVLEGFDALGRERSVERLYDPKGQETAAPSVDTSADVWLYDSEQRVISNAAELSRMVDDSQLFESCVAQHYFRFAHARVESTTRDGCLLSEMEAVARSGAPLADLLKTVARHPTFNQRTFP